MQAVNVTKLCHSYSGGTETPILDDLSLTLNQGETLALVGASGSGKSTLLNLIGGLETLQSGDIQIFDESLAHADEATRTRLRRGTIGFVYQSFNLIPTLNVIDNIRLPLALAGRTHAQQQGRINELLTAVGLQGRAKAFPDALSGGEQQRVALARAVAHEPRLVLADEPTGNLDAKNGQQVIALLQSLVANHNTSLLLVTHSHQVAQCANRILAMHDGKLVDQPKDTVANTW